MANLTEKAAIVSLGNILRRISLFLSGILVVRFLTQTQLGSFRQVNLVFNLCSMALLFGIPNSVYFFIPKAREDEQRGILTQTYFTLFIFGILSAIGVFWAAPLIASVFNNPQLPSLLRTYAPYLAFSLPMASFFAVMMSLKNSIKASIVRIGVTLTQILATLIPVLLGCSLRTVFITMLVVNSCVSIAAVWFSIHLSPEGSFRSPKGFALQQIKFSLPFGIGTIVSYLSKEIDKLFISTFFSVTQFAVYSVGALELPITSYFASAITTVLLPEFVQLFEKNKIEEIIQTWKESRRKLALITFPIIFWLFFISPEFLTFVYGNNYAEAVPILQIYILIPLLENFASRGILHAKGKTQLILYASLVTFFSNIVLNYVFIHLLAEKGPPVATVIAIMLTEIYIFIKVSHELNISWTAIFPWKEYQKISVACFLGGIPSFLLRIFHLFEQSELSFLLVTSIFFGIIVGGSYLLVILKQHDVELVGKYVNRLPGGKGLIHRILMLRMK
ncbi:MAG: oligosaccharide flippase family protein [Candidatus Vecturithrix sp.]|jgi:O-antigen/teichoic acid export membrane protein|nr:oligosaccharide flippase family protein [Candidatus Vecturithrix sp.]